MPSCRAGAETYCHDFFGRNFLGMRSDGSSGLSQHGVPIHGNIFGQSSFASHALCHERNVVVVPKDVPDDLKGPLACGVQTGAGAVMNALHIETGQSLAVFGLGSVGLSAIMAARIVGASPDYRRRSAPGPARLGKGTGSDRSITATDTDVVARIMALTGYGVDFSIDATGVPAVIEQAVRVLAPRGTLWRCRRLTPGARLSADLTLLLGGGRHIRGIVEGDSQPDIFNPRLIEFYRHGAFPFDRLVRFYDFSEINQAVADSESGQAIKPIVHAPL